MLTCKPIRRLAHWRVIYTKEHYHVPHRRPLTSHSAPVGHSPASLSYVCCVLTEPPATPSSTVYHYSQTPSPYLPVFTLFFLPKTRQQRGAAKIGCRGAQSPSRACGSFSTWGTCLHVRLSPDNFSCACSELLVAGNTLSLLSFPLKVPMGGYDS